MRSNPTGSAETGDGAAALVGGAGSPTNAAADGSGAGLHPQPGMALAVVSLGLYQALLITPHWFRAPTYREWAAHPGPVGGALLLAGAALLWIRLFPLKRRSIVVASFGLAAVNFGAMAVVFLRANALHGTLVYSALALAVLALGLLTAGADRSPRWWPSTARPLAVTVHAIALVTGLLMLRWPDQYAAPIYAAMRPSLTAYGAAFAGLGAALLLGETIFGGRWRRIRGVGEFVLFAVLLLFGFGFVAAHTWTGVMTYAVLSIGVLDPSPLDRWVGWRTTRHAVATSPLRRRVALVAATALVGSALGLTLILTANSEAASRREVEAGGAELATVVADEIQGYLRSHLRVVELAAALPYIRTMDPARGRSALESVLGAFPEFDSVALVDLSGRQVARLPDAPLIDMAGLPLVQRALAGEAVVFGGVVTSPRTGEPLIAMSAAVRDERSGQVVGAVAAALTLSTLSDFVSSIDAADGRVVFVVDSEGLLVAHPSPETLLERGRLVGSPPVEQAMAGREGALTYTTGAQRHLAAVATIEDFGWGVVAQRPESMALAQVWAARNRAYLVLVAAALVLAVLGMALAYVLVKPALALIGPVTALARGHYDTPLPGAGDGELGDLVRGFGQMRDALHSREALLVAKNAELAVATAAAENASRLQSSFLSTVSHELRTPMTSIKGYVELLLDGEAGDLNPEQLNFLGVVRANSERLVRLVNDVLDLAKIEAGRLDLSPEAVDLGPIVDQIRAELAPQAAAKGLDLWVEVPAGLPPLVADPARLHQIVLNLAANAVKFTETGRVAIAARASAGGGGIEIAVSDTGIGIEPEALAFVFDEFRQADDSVTRRFGGTGLGLSISHKLATLHGGTITAASVPGAGSTFTLCLPLASAPTGPTLAPGRPRPTPAAEVGAPSAAVPDDPRGAPVLLIEDDPDFAGLVRQAIAAEGRRLVHTPSGADGLRLAAELQPELVLLDIVLDADLDGWQVLHRLRADPATAGLPVVVVSVSDERRLAATLGATDYIVKPIARSALSGALRRFGARPPAAVLIVGDEPAQRQLLARMLTANGYLVRTATGGEASPREIEHSAPDLLILDLKAPDTDGAAVLVAVRAAPATRHLPVLIVTARDIGPEDLAWLGRHPADVLPGSDLSTEALLSKVRAALKGRPIAAAGGTD